LSDYLDQILRVSCRAHIISWLLLSFGIFKAGNSCFCSHFLQVNLIHIKLNVCLFFVFYAQPQFSADLHEIWHAARALSLRTPFIYAAANGRRPLSGHSKLVASNHNGSMDICMMMSRVDVMFRSSYRLSPCMGSRAVMHSNF